MIVVDSSVIILLGKIGNLALLEKCFKKVEIPNVVYQEIAEKKNTNEFLQLQKAVKDNWIKTIETHTPEQYSSIGLGELHCIILAKNKNSVFITDDKKACFLGETLGLEVHGTLYVIFQALKKGHISSKKAAIKLINQLLENGLYLSTEVYAQTLELINSI